MSAQQDRQEIGDRVREAMNARYRGNRTQGSIAESLGFTTDAFSRSVNGERAFTTGELARIADAFNADLHYLITGEPDPLRAVVAARHAYDPETSTYHHDEARQKTDRDGVVLAYRQAAPWLAPSDVALPTTPDDCRDLLEEAATTESDGEAFVADFAHWVEDALGIDVIRLPGLDTDYSITVGDQRVILLKTEPNWFYSNWSLAHEVAHLCLGHHGADGTHSSTIAETAANAFAAELLLPMRLIDTVNWATATATDAAQFVWDTGVSTTALRNRLDNLDRTYSGDVDGCLVPPTQRLLRRNPVPDTTRRSVKTRSERLSTIHDPITERMAHAAERRISARLINALRDGVEAGHLNTGTLAWLLDVDPLTLELDTPDIPTPAFDDATGPDRDHATDDLLGLLGAPTGSSLGTGD